MAARYRAARHHRRRCYPAAVEWLRIPLMALTGLCALGVVWWCVALFRMVRELQLVTRVREGLGLPEPPGGWPRVSVVIPAHNEEALAPACARSVLASEYPDFEAIFVLDRCTDATLERLRPLAAADPRLRILENGSCPPDWAGKCNAARVGAAAATGEMLLFTDADTHFQPGLMRASVALAKHRGLALLSLMSTLTAERWFERVIQPAAAMMLMQLYPISAANRAVNPRVFANGQFMLFERAVYDRLGGHAAVKDDLLEDIAFARAVRDRARARSGLFVADGMLLVRMYESLAALSEGWKRIFIEACLRKPARLWRKGAEVLAVGVILPAIQAVTIVAALAAAAVDPPLAATAGGTALLGLLLQWLVVGVVFRQARAPALGALLYPVGAWVVARCLRHGARDLRARRPVRWGGRDYVLEPR